MAAGPVPVGRGADIQRHADAVAGVEAAAADLGQFPAGAEVAGPPLRVRLEAAGRQHHRLSLDRLDPVRHLDQLAGSRDYCLQHIEEPRTKADTDALERALLLLPPYTRQEQDCG